MPAIPLDQAPPEVGHAPIASPPGQNTCKQQAASVRVTTQAAHA